MPQSSARTVVNATAILTGLTEWDHEWTEDGLVHLRPRRAPGQTLIPNGVELLLDRDAVDSLLTALTEAFAPANEPQRATLRALPGGALRA